MSHIGRSIFAPHSRRVILHTNRPNMRISSKAFSTFPC
jgi:hypothetical protein